MTDMPIKILHVISNLSPRSGGPTTVVRSLSAYQVMALSDVTICTTNWGQLAVEKKALNIGVHENGVTYRCFSSESPLAFSPAMYKWLGRHLRLFDVVHIHGLYRFPVTAAAWWARREGVPFMIMPHGCLDPFLYSQSRYNLPLKRIYERLFDIPNLNHASAIHYTSEEEARQAAHLRLRARPIVVPNGIDWESYRRLPQRGCFRKRLLLNDQVPLVLFLGRINFKKGLDVLVLAFSLVIQKHPNARLAFVGPDNEGYGSKVKRWCEEKGIEDKVLFVDHLGPEEVKQAYVDADVFVLPSYTENFGLTVVESMACGCPVIISDRVNIWRQVEQVKAGIVVRLDPEAVAKAITRLLEDRETARTIGTRGRQAAEKFYGWPSIVERLTRVYRDLIEIRRSATSCR